MQVDSVGTSDNVAPVSFRRTKRKDHRDSLRRDDGDAALRKDDAAAAKRRKHFTVEVHRFSRRRQ
jgi:hypothetical protein